ncbi:hypothetical protein [Rhizobium leguminosarum]|uniref:hypothetical protein n=1 Tax=Rhizobium leguminosarum TaxID=384 RepID=UPI001C93CD4B|nr:hypothetical protein [Rhizobium leguminosarum]MBY5826573.1 hypothetical protein [Rhizobium leguminosarum]
MPWMVAKKILAEYSVPAGHGWDNTLEAVSTSDLRNVDVSGLTDAYVDHLCFGEKSIRLYTFSAKDMAQLRTSITSFKSPAALPLPLTGTALKKAALSDPSLIYVRSAADGITAVYSSIRRKDEQVRINTSAFNAATLKALGDYDEIIGIQSRRLQAYDVVWLPKKGNTVEVRTDHLVGETKETINNAQQKIYADLHAKSGSHQLVSPVDLFSVIKPIYDNANEGIVIELAFATSTGSTKHEKMRNHSDCLRREVYHVNGKAALKTQIEPYRIGVTWPVESADGSGIAPELFLEGRATMAGSTSPGLHTATIRKCRNRADYDRVLTKLEEYL